MRRNVTISIAMTFTAIAATALGGTTAAFASSVATKPASLPRVAAIRALTPTALQKAGGPTVVCISGVPAIAKPAQGAMPKGAVTKYAIAVPAIAKGVVTKRAAKYAIAVPGRVKYAIVVPARAKGASAIPALAVPASAPTRTAKTALRAPAIIAAPAGACVSLVPAPSRRHA